MTPAQFFETFDLLSDLPNAVGKMRELILDLAVRGKLVVRQEDDLPISVTCPRFASSHRSGREVGGPEHWLSVQLKEIGTWSGGGTPSKNQSEYWNGNIPWVSPKDMKKLRIADAQDHISQAALNSSAAKLISPGSILFVVRGMILAHSFPVAIAEAEVTINQDMKAITPWYPETKDYVILAMQASKKLILNLVDRSTHGTCKLSTEALEKFCIGIPPLAEQKRIVAKVDELMALCDRLEAQQKQREAQQAALVQASLTRFTDAPTPTNLEFLFHKSYAVDPAELRKTILDLAVTGKLLNQGLMSYVHPVSQAVDTEGRPILPSGWRLVSLASICLSVTDGDHLPPPKSETGVPFLVIGDVRWGTIKFDGCRHVSREYYEKLDPIRKPRQGDILYTLVGSFGIPIVVDTEREFCVQRHMGIIKPSTDIDVSFLAYGLQSAFIYKQAAACATGTAQKTVPLSGLRKLSIPLPPLAEQKRIVAKVEELMGVVDRLEAQLAASREVGAKLIEAVVAEIAAAA